MAKVRRVMDEGGVHFQTAELGRVDVGGGGTVAKFVARRNVDTIDLGVPVLSMHAPFELVAKVDELTTSSTALAAQVDYISMMTDTDTGVE